MAFLNIRKEYNKMKLDMHCHTKEGSIDGKICLEDYIINLKSKGFDGMLITDHNSYKAFRYWKKHLKEKYQDSFKVFKGIEYDTLDGGHMIIIMPEHIKLKLLELRGLSTSILIEIVHRLGGVIGPAHPCGEKFLSIANTRCYKRNSDIMKKFDFIEAFNACEALEKNDMARELAEKYDKKCTGGSDAHREDCIGLGYTIIPCDAESESELIDCIKNREIQFEASGTIYKGTTKEKIGKVNKLLVNGFWVYNKTAAFIKRRKRKMELRLHQNTR